MSAPTPLLRRPVPVQADAQPKRKRESTAASSSIDMEQLASIVAIVSRNAPARELPTSGHLVQVVQEKPAPTSLMSPDAIAVDADRSNVSPGEDVHQDEDRPLRTSQWLAHPIDIGVDNTVTNTQPEVETRLRTLEDRLRELHEVNFDLTDRLGRMGGLVEGGSDDSDAPPPTYTPANR